jgi:hypothetical protein
MWCWHQGVTRIGQGNKGKRNKEREIKTEQVGGGREREKQTAQVRKCVCVCVLEREREKERELLSHSLKDYRNYSIKLQFREVWIMFSYQRAPVKRPSITYNIYIYIYMWVCVCVCVCMCVMISGEIRLLQDL